MTRAERNIQWIEGHLRVPEGRLVGKPVRLHSEQKRIIRGIYDRPRGSRAVRRAIISMARKNGKTGLVSMLLLLHLCGPEATPNSQLYSAAQSRDQAAVLFTYASKMVRMSPDLESFVTIRDSSKELFCAELGTKYRALSAEVPTAYGLSPVFVVHDELGQVRGPRSELYEALETATGAHDEPLSIVISTQAPTDADLLSLLIDDAEKEQASKDSTTKLFLWAAPEDADPWSEATWKLANPMYGTLLNPDVVREQAEAARRMPSREASFRNLILNQRVNTSSPLISQSAWTACAGAPDPAVAENGPVYMGIDLSSRNDLTALAWIAQDADKVWHAWVEFFAPEVGLLERSRRDRVPYDIWADQGFITLTPGASVDLEFVAIRLIELNDDLGNIVAAAYDRWRMDVMIKELIRLGAGPPLLPDGERPGVLRPFGQGFRDMSPAIDTLEAVIINGKLRHGGNPVLTMCAANAIAKRDPAGNRKLDKSKATGRIDGLQALTMAFGVTSTITEEPAGPSVYEERGLLEV